MIPLGKKGSGNEFPNQLTSGQDNSGSNTMLSDVSLWESAAKWLAGIVVTMTGLYTGAVHKFYHSRFKTVDDKIDSQDERLSKVEETLAEHDKQLATIDVHLVNGHEDRQEIKESLRRVEEKLDRVCGN